MSSPQFARLSLLASLICFAVSGVARADDSFWQSDFETARRQAKSEGKPLLLVFTGSDWHPQCVGLQAETLGTEAFRSEAAKQFVGLIVDFPRKTKLPDEVQQRNVELNTRYRVDTLPTIVLTDAEGKQIGRSGYFAGGGAAFARFLQGTLATHERVVEMKSRLGSLTGIERARLLDTIVETSERIGGDAVEFERLRDELLALDLSAAADLKRKHLFRKGMTTAVGLLRAKKPLEAKVAYDRVLAMADLTADQKQEALIAQGGCYVATKEYDRVCEILERARDAAPTSYRVKFIDSKFKELAPPAAAQRSLRKANDAMAGAVGVERAKALDRIVEARKVLIGFVSDPNYATTINELVRQIVELDGENVAGLKAKYADHASWPEPGEIERKLTPPQIERLNRASDLSAKVVAIYDRKQYAEALPLAEEVLVVRKEILGEKHAGTAQAIHNVGSQYYGMNRFHEAIPYFEQALKIRRTVLGTGEMQTIESIGMLGSAYYEAGNYVAGRLLLEESLALQVEIYGERNPNTVRARNNLGALLRLAGDPRAACDQFERVLAIKTELYGPKHQETLATMGNLASALMTSGDLAAARPIHERVVTLRRETLGDKHPDTALALNNLGELLRETRDLDAAIPRLQQALTIYLQAHGEKHLQTAVVHNALGSAFADLGNSELSRRHHEKALAVRRELLGDDHPDTAMSLNNLAATQSAVGNYVVARKSYEEAVEILRKVLGNDHPNIAQGISNVAGTYEAEGDYETAQRLMSEAVDIYRRTAGDKHPATVRAIVHAATTHFDLSNFERVVELLSEGLAVMHELKDALCAVSSETEALQIVNSDRWVIDLLVSAYPYTDRTPDALYSNLWRGRSAVYRLAADRRSTQDRSLSPEVRELHRLWIEARRDVARMTLAPAPDDAKQFQARREQLRRTTARKEELERQLAAAAPQVVDGEARRSRTPEELIKTLPDDAVFIDLVQYSHCFHDPAIPGRKGRGSTPSYVVFLLSHDRPVQRIDLGPAAPIEAAVKAWREAIVAGSVTSAAADLRRLVWEPIAEKFPSGVSTVYLAPDGPLTSLPWAAVPGREAGTVLLEEFRLAIVPNGRVLLAQLETKAEPNAVDGGALLAVGGVQYGVAPIDRASSLASAGLRAAATDEKHPLRWPELPATLREIEEVERYRGDRELIKLVGNEAGTAQIVARLPEARWAVFATHGFFADPTMRSAMQVDERLVRGDFNWNRSGPVGRNPLLLSGLVFTGANLPRATDATGIPQGDGGILTAEAIAGLPLFKLELAVLSACETGLGEVAGGEGTFGLQRAFHVAGCRNIVASLWKVDDEATAALMSMFYENLWRKNEPPLDALRNAQLSILRNPAQITAFSSRGLGVAKPLPGGSKPAVAPTPARTDVRRWAAFQLSGVGR